MTTASRHDTSRQARTESRHASARTPLWIAGAALAGLLGGVAWQYPRAERAQGVAAYASRALDAARLEAALSAAVIAAQHGEYEIGRQRASTFFTGLQYRVLPRAPGAAAASARALLGQRDAIITALARSDPASASLLTQTLIRYRETIRQAGLDSAVVAAAAR